MGCKNCVLRYGLHPWSKNYGFTPFFHKREDATYSTKIKFTPSEVEMLRVKAVLFVSKVKTIINE